ncbi:TAXI family TRAP transporter solute-binding subunit [Nitrobacter sp.]|uniref:TAXI family TRAP transporter solute-binding subunit n=1 Tax=Nitrobacter sp. TaxID=29420 RepID=UPI003F65295C
MTSDSSRLSTRPKADGPGAVQSPESRRSVRRKFALVLLAGVLALTGAVAGIYYYSMRPVVLQVAVGPANSDDAKVVQGLAQAFARSHQQIRLHPVLTDGVTASASALSNGEADLAIVRGDLDVPKNAQAVATLRKSVAVLWVPPRPKGKNAKATKIKTIAQLAGHRVGVVGQTDANVNLLKVILQQYNVDPAKVDIVRFATAEVAQAIRAQKADAFLAAGPVNSKITADAIAASARDGGAPTFLAIDSADTIAQNHPVYEAAEIPPGAFGGSPARPDEEVKTISFSHHIVARKSLSDATVAAFTRQLFAIRQQIISDFPLAAKIETPDTDKDAVIPVHPGAAAYVDGEEKTFLDRYSDYIWWALMAMSATGSVGAWFASHLKKEERVGNMTQRDRLLDMIALARRSDSADDLDQMQAEADAILRDTLNRFENGAIEEGSLAAFNIALEQFHNAVADRKWLLMSTPPRPLTASVQLRATGP